MTFDETPSGVRPGGSAYYSALTAKRLGLSVGLLTSAPPDYPRDVFPKGIEVSTVLRCKDYYYQQVGDTQTALATYAAIPAGKTGGEECRICRRCEGVCPNGIRIVEGLTAARALFTQLA